MSGRASQSSTALILYVAPSNRHYHKQDASHFDYSPGRMPGPLIALLVGARFQPGLTQVVPTLDPFAVASSVTHGARESPGTMSHRTWELWGTEVCPHRLCVVPPVMPGGESLRYPCPPRVRVCWELIKYSLQIDRVSAGT